MPTYATKADCLDFGVDFHGADDTAINAMIVKAERDIDGLLPGYDVNDVTGRKLDPADLTSSQRRALTDATCAQVEYRQEMGESFFIRGQRDETSGPDFTVKGKLPRIGPKVAAGLRGLGLTGRTQTARARA